MESIYGNNKKYLQSLTAGSDYYRCASTIRPMANEYSSYHNTLGRRSLVGVGPYTHMNKYSYPTDVSLSSHYGYTSWGLWRDNGNMSSSSPMYSKKQQNIKSFSILLMSAAFIVVLAVLCVAGLAFYFSTFKSDLNDSILVFDCTFRVTKGDVYTTGLKYNTTAAFRQKSQFYERVIGTSLEKSGLTVSKAEINDFGDGPTIVLSFRVFLDMRQIKMTINNVEEHIRHAFLDEMAQSNSVFKNVKVDADSIEIKRLLDQEVLKYASFITEEQMTPHVRKVEDGSTATLSSSSTGSGGSIQRTRKPVTIEKPLQNSKIQLNNKGKDEQKFSTELESDIDTENLPVIQGSFEITKTEADITQKRDEVKQQQPASTLKPFYVSPATIKVKSSDKKGIENVKTSSMNDKLDAVIVFTTPKSTPTAKIEKVISTTKKMRPTTTKSTTTTATTTTTTTEPSTIAIPLELETTEFPINLNNETLLEKIFEAIINDSMPEEIVDQKRLEMNENFPKLDVNLFTSAPVLDQEPWMPINPVVEEQKKQSLPEVLLYRNKQTDIESILNTEMPPNGQVYYQSYTNPSFQSSTLGIEPLGSADVQPYPLPVDKIHMSPDEIPDFKYMTPTAVSESESIMNLTYDADKFEHLGGGVIVKKHDPENENKTDKVIVSTTTTKLEIASDDDADEDDEDENDDEDFETSIETFNKTDNNSISFESLDLESRINNEDEVENATEKLNFKNIKDYIMTRNQTIESNNAYIITANNITDVADAEFSSTTTTTTTTEKALESSTMKPTTYIEVETVKYNPPAVQNVQNQTQKYEEPQLFPIWEFVNGTRVTPSEVSPTKKVFNETLQALIVENFQLSTTPASIQATEIKSKLQNNTNIQNLSTIFDTLASKLGIKTEVSSKTPPFSSLHKLKQSTNKPRPTTRPTAASVSKKRRTTTPRRKTNTRVTKTTPKPTTTTTATTTTTSTEEPPKIIVHDDIDGVVPVMLETSSESTEVLVGEAEVEVIDPNKYEEILRMSSSAEVTSSTPPSLITLLPPKSNSGIKNYRPSIVRNDGRSQTPRSTWVQSSNGNASKKKNNTVSETVVRASMVFDA